MLRFVEPVFSMPAALARIECFGKPEYAEVRGQKCEFSTGSSGSPGAPAAHSCSPAMRWEHHGPTDRVEPRPNRRDFSGRYQFGHGIGSGIQLPFYRSRSEE